MVATWRPVEIRTQSLNPKPSTLNPIHIYIYIHTSISLCLYVCLFGLTILRWGLAELEAGICKLALLAQLSLNLQVRA